jgi:p21-activated kinase 1
MQKKPEISLPQAPVHLVHGKYNSSTGECIGMSKEWQQLLQKSGITPLEQEKNTQALMDLVKFYQEGGMGGNDAVWEKMSHVAATPTSPTQPLRVGQRGDREKKKDSEEGRNAAGAENSMSNFAGAGAGDGAFQAARPAPVPPGSPLRPLQNRSSTFFHVSTLST